MSFKPKTPRRKASMSVDLNSAAAQQVQVVVRCRPLNLREKAENVSTALACHPDEKEVRVVQKSRPGHPKTYTFDRVFGQYAQQSEVFDSTVAPIVNEVLQGFNCTVFAYGQTGTGKTHTMEGDFKNPEQAGIIPRSVRAIFNHLQKGNSEYSVRVSYMEVYNEELQDLLSPSEKKLRLCDDARNGVTCQNLEEILVNDTDHIFKILETAVKNRHVAETKCNERSSRSHSIFTLKIHIKETTPDGEDLMKIGKLNLVDLAGSECVGRSGATGVRGREASNINRSLLTLGRVITALVEHSGHIPYRDSKLTRLLQESLGGKAKTCVIATLTPSADSLEETLSTLDYMHNAKKIKNRPQANQRMSKRTLIKEYSQDIERMKMMLQAARDKNGVYLPAEQYAEMETQISSQKTQLEELEGVLETRQKELSQLQENFTKTKLELATTSQTLQQTESTLKSTTDQLHETEGQLQEKVEEVEDCEAVISEHEHVEQTLHKQGGATKAQLVDARGDVDGLFAKVAREEALEKKNVGATRRLVEGSNRCITTLTSELTQFQERQASIATSLKGSMLGLLQHQQDSSFAAITALDEMCESLSKDLKQGSEQSGEQVGEQEEALGVVETHIRETAAREVEWEKVQATRLTEFLHSLKAQLSSQQETLNAWSKQVSQRLEQGAGVVKEFTDEQIGGMKELRETMETEVNAQVGALEAQCEELQQRQQQQEQSAEGRLQGLEEKLGGLLRAFVSKEQSLTQKWVQSAVTSSQKVSSSLQELSRKANDTVDGATDQAAIFAEKFDADFEAGQEQLNEVSQQAAEQTSSLAAQVDIETQSCAKESEVHLQAIESDLEQTKEHVNNLREMRTEHAQVQQQRSDDALESLSSQQKGVRTIVEEGTESVQERGGGTREECEHAHADVEAFIGEQQARISETQAVVSAFAEEEFGVYEATGETPMPRDVQVIANFAATRSRDEVVSAYRQAKAKKSLKFGEFQALVSATHEEINNANAKEENEQESVVEKESGEPSEVEESQSDQATDRAFDRSSKSPPVEKPKASASAPPAPEIAQFKRQKSNSSLASATPKRKTKKASQMKVAELREELKKLGLDTTGLKTVLVKRLEAALASAAADENTGTPVFQNGKGSKTQSAPLTPRALNTE